ncbi:putative laccase-5 [Hordeum vulgare]|nr:putative laccase-5 [Hordeum vulgare]
MPRVLQLLYRWEFVRVRLVLADHHSGQEKEDHLMRTIMERLVREAEEVTAHNRRKLEIEQIFFEQGITTSQASASKEADLRVMKAEQAKV